VSLGYGEVVAIVIGSLAGFIIFVSLVSILCRRKRLVHQHVSGVSVPLGNMHSAVAAPNGQQFYPVQPPGFNGPVQPQAFNGQFAGPPPIYSSLYPKPNEAVMPTGMPEPYSPQVQTTSN
jgi:hypothetical protein